MNTRETVKLVEKLIELTQDNIISWNTCESYPSLSSMERLDIIYCTEHLGQKLRVYKYFYRFYTDEDEYHLIEGYRLETFDGISNKLLYRFQEINNIKDLLDTVMYQSSNIEQFYNMLMS